MAVLAGGVRMKKILFKIISGLVVVVLAHGMAHAELPVQQSFAPLVKKTGPAVVNIYAKRVVQEQMRAISPFFNDPFFNQFFNAPQFGGPVRQRIENSLGSGVIVDPNGVIATNNHVIKDATEINVVTADGREFAAQKLLADARTDLAILKIDTKGEKLPVLELTDSDAVQVGDIVLAIGNPFGVGQTVTSGIVSGLARTDVGVSDYSFFIQTDAAINPGNSGGALVDMQGRLIGINSAIFSSSGGSLGIGFAIPSNMVKTIIEASRHGNKIVLPWTGLSSQAVTPDMLEGLGLKKAQGALIKHVYPNGPAAKAGIRVGDVILTINGKEVQDPLALKYRLATIPIGSSVQLQVFRSGKTIDVTLTAVAPPEDPPRDETKIKGANPFSGAVVANISPALIEEIGQLSQESGVVILGTEGGVAARLGLQRSDVILSVNREKVTSVGQLKALLKSDRNGWQVQLQRSGQVINLTITG
ncbi:MAG: Do family serine endopeptidase [Proteobacteria bacterium]|nr:Do family serine endopeptidase [Pseudomonadota bacterium]